MSVKNKQQKIILTKTEEVLDKLRSGCSGEPFEDVEIRVERQTFTGKVDFSNVTFGKNVSFEEVERAIAQFDNY